MPLPPYAMLAARPLRPEAMSLDGLSKRQIESHFAVYRDEISQINELHRRLQSPDGIDPAQLVDLKAAQVRLFNSIKLHEAYFEGLSHGAGISPPVNRLLGRDFGSVDNWRREFSAIGAAADGWAVLAFDRDDARLHNFPIVDDGGLWNAVPVLALDVHDHAFSIDYAGDRPAYVQAFLDNIDWRVVGRMLSGIIHLWINQPGVRNSG